MTSYGNRIQTVLPYALYSLFNQKVLPDMIVLWLDRSTLITPILKGFQKKGLQIRFCKDFKSYNKLIHSLICFPNDVIVTIDDDTYYQTNWFKELKLSYMKNPKKIHFNRAHEIKVQGKHIMPYRDWRFCVTKNFNYDLLFPTGVGGVLYPPDSLSEICTDESEFLDLAPQADDIWFWAMAQLKKTKYQLVKHGLKCFFPISKQEFEKPLWHNNMLEGGNDKQIKQVFKRFPELKKKILQKSSHH